MNIIQKSASSASYYKKNFNLAKKFPKKINISIFFQDLTMFKTDLSGLRKKLGDFFVLIGSKCAVDSFYQRNNLNIFDKVICLDNLSFDNLEKTVHNLLHKVKDHIYDLGFLTNDECLIHRVAELREKFNIEGPKLVDVKKFTDKITMKGRLKDSSITLPKYKKFSKEDSKLLQTDTSKIADYLKFPIFSKPISDASSHGIEILYNESNLQTWLDKHKDNLNLFELDEFIEGSLYHCDSLVKDNQVLFSQVSKYAYPCSNFLEGKILGSMFLAEEDKIALEIKEFNKLVIDKLSPVPNGATHLEVFRKNDNSLVFLEVACRAPGSLVTAMYKKALGVNIESAHFNLQMNRECDMEITSVNRNAFWIWYPSEAGVVKSLNSPVISSEFLLEWKVKEGQVLTNPSSLDDYVLGILAWSNDIDALKEDFKKLESFKAVSYE